MTENELKLRRLLAVAYSGVQHLYADDGELVDSTKFPVIDYYRDTVEQIEDAIYQRSTAVLSCRNFLKSISDKGLRIV